MTRDGISVFVLSPLAFAFAFPTVSLIGTSQSWPCWTLLCQSGWKHLGGQVQHFAKVVDAFIREKIIMPLPAELLSNIVARAKRLHNHHDVQVGNLFELVVLRCPRIFLHDYHTFFEHMF